MEALLLDFNGTLSDDEPLLCEIFMDLFAEAGKPLSEREYYAQLAGRSDPEIVEAWLGEPRPELVEEKIRRYRNEIRTGWTVHLTVVCALSAVASRFPVAVVSGSAREEIEHVLRAARALDLISAIVSADEVTHGKPDPEGYRRALHALRVEPDEAIAVEDSDVGVAAAKAAGIYCIAVTSTMAAERLSQADELADRFDADFLRGLLSRS